MKVREPFLIGPGLRDLQVWSALDRSVGRQGTFKAGSVLRSGLGWLPFRCAAAGERTGGVLSGTRDPDPSSRIRIAPPLLPGCHRGS